MPPVCPLSGSSDVTLLDSLNTQDIIALYRDTLGIETADEFGDVKQIGYYRSNTTQLRFFDPLVTGSPKFYEQLQQHTWYYAEDREEFSFAGRLVKPQQAVLEIGCGKGVFADLLPPVQYVGLEFNAEAIRKARARGLTVLNESIEAHAVTHPAAYDVVCAFQVLEHVRDIAGFIAASRTCLQPGGLLIYSVPSADSFLSWSVNNMLNIVPHHVSQWSEQALRSVGQIFGLEVVEIRREQLRKEHSSAYIGAMIHRPAARLMGRPGCLLNTSPVYKLVTRAIAPLGRRLAPLLLAQRSQLVGHSVYAVYRKPALQNGTSL